MRITLILIVFTIQISNAQINLIPDPSFEISTDCPTNFTTPGNPIALKHWFSPTEGTPDLFSGCKIGECGVPLNWAGICYSPDGDNYAGIYVASMGIHGYQEYISTRLTDSLQKDVVYTLSFLTKPATYSRYKVDSMGFLFTRDSIMHADSMRITSSESVSTYLVGSHLDDPSIWNIGNAEYKAHGGERFLTIGYFGIVDTSHVKKREAYKAGNSMIRSSAYYYLDYVTLSSPMHKTPFPINEQFVMDNVYFEFDEYSLNSKAIVDLRRLSGFIKNNPDLKIRIQGHADSVGTFSYNLRLSRRRALSVSQELGKMGVAKGQLIIEAFGEERSISDLDELNRRVEFLIEDQ